MKLATLFALLVVIFTATAIVSAQEAEWTFRNFLLDKTDYFEIQQAISTNGSVEYIADQPSRQLYITADDATDTSSLSCASYVNATKVDGAETISDISQLFNFSLSFDQTKNNTGVIKATKSDLATIPTDNEVPFTFTTVDKVHIATGKISQDTEFQLVVAASDRFILTIFDKGQRVTFVAKKVLVVIDKTFFQQYGTYIMMGGMMIMQLYLQGNKQPEAEEGAEPQQ